jgi:hypothetical protein
METMERRTDPRVEKHETAVFKVLGTNEKEKSFELRPTQVQNISKSGLCAGFDRKLEPGSMLRVNFFRNTGGNRKNDAIKAFCEVQWSRYDGNGRFITGLHFIAINDDDAKKLDEYVAEHARAI